MAQPGPGSAQAQGLSLAPGLRGLAWLSLDKPYAMRYDHSGMKCANEKCSKRFKPGKPWARYCSRRCGDAARMRTHYWRVKKAAKKQRKGR